MDHRTDKVWVLGIQSKLYQWSKANPDDQWCDMWGWLTDLRVCCVTPGSAFPPTKVGARLGLTG